MSDTLLADMVKEGFQGTDADLATSLFEYGLAWIEKTGETGKQEFHFRYRIRGEDESNSVFDWGWLAADTDPFEEWNWVDWNAFLSFLGDDKESWKTRGLPYQVADLISYYGYEEIMGTTYYEGFKIITE